MKFGEIIQFIRSACRKLKELCLRLFSKRPPIVEENSENSEDQDPKDSPPEEKAKTKDKSSKVDKEPDSIHHRRRKLSPSEKTETAPSDSPPPDSTKNLEPQSESGQGKDSKKPTKPVGARGKRPDKPKQPAKTTIVRPKPPPPQCRFVCYEDNRGWAVALAVEAGQDVQSVRQGNNELSAKNCRYILEDISAKVTIEFKGGHSSQSFQLLKEHKFAVFKMRKDWKGEGQKVKTLSSGDYVVFAH